jgi:hypothetical protein
MPSPANRSVEKEVIRSYCLVHARRTIFELKETYPAECEVVLKVVSKVYQHDAEAAALSACHYPNFFTERCTSS